MKRKIQEIGGSFLISIPKNWAKLHKLAKGADLEIEPNEKGQLVVAPIIEKAALRKVRKSLKYSPHMGTELFRAYFSGASEIEITSENPFTPDQRAEIKEFADSILSVEIVEEDVRKVLLQNYGYELMPIDQSLKRLFQLSYSMLNDVMKEKITKQLLHSLSERERTVDKFYFMIVTHVNRLAVLGAYDKEISYAKALHYRIAAARVEMISDKIVEMSELFYNSPQDIKSEMVPILEEVSRKVLEFYKSSFDVFLSGEYRSSGELWNRMDDLLAEIDVCLEGTTARCCSGRKSKAERRTYCSMRKILNNLKDILRFAKDIADLAI
ncbi:MAG: phosphate uptake regulator PhoU [archaeon]